MSNKLAKVIADYIYSDYTDYGILINGSWGSGKSFFLKNNLQDELTKLRCVGKNLIHISLFGIKNEEELIAKIVRAKIPFLDKAPVNGAFAILQMVGTRFKGTENFRFKTISKSEQKQIFKLLNIGTENDIYIFDDLERINNEDALLSIFGYINEISENNNSKVILVADESKLFKYEKYQEFKEKLIRFTHTYEMEGDKIIKIFIDNINSEDFKMFFLADEELLLNKLWEWHQISGNNNLRTLQFILFIFQNIFHHFKSIQNRNKNFDRALLERLLFFITTYSYELKSKQLPADLQILKAISEKLDKSNFMISQWREKIKNQIKRNYQSGLERKENDYELKASDRLIYNFEQKYQIGEDKNHFEFYDVVKDYILNGFLNEFEFEEKVKFDIKCYEDEKPEEEQVLDKISRFLILEERECEIELEKLLSYVKSNKYSFARIPVIFQVVKDFLHYIPIRNIDDVKIIFKQTIDKSVFEGQNDRPSIRLESGDDQDKIEIWEYYEKAFNSYINKKDEYSAQNILKNFFELNIQSFREKLWDEKNRELLIFSPENINAGDFFNTFKSMSNPNKNEILRAFRNGQRYANGLKENKEMERIFFEQLYENFKLYLELEKDNINKRIGYLNISQFNDWIKLVLER